VLVKKPSDQQQQPSTGKTYAERQLASRVETVPLSEDHKPNRKEEELRIKKLGGKGVYDAHAYMRVYGYVYLSPYLSRVIP